MIKVNKKQQILNDTAGEITIELYQTYQPFSDGYTGRYRGSLNLDVQEVAQLKAQLEELKLD